MGMLFLTNPELGEIDTPHGKMKFLQINGITGPELDAFFAKEVRALDMGAALAAKDPLILTDLARRENSVALPGTAPPAPTPQPQPADAPAHTLQPTAQPAKPPPATQPTGLLRRLFCNKT